MKFFDADATRAALPFDKLIDSIRDMFAKGCEVPLRHNHAIPGKTDEKNSVLIMPAWNQGEYLGIKTVTIFPNNANHSLPGLFSTYMLYSAVTGEPLAYLDGNEITSRRTAAASALAASLIAPVRTKRQLVVGAGRVGSLVPEAYRAILPIEEFLVWDINKDNAERLVNRLNDEGLDASLAEDLAQAVQQSDIITCATLAQTPYIDGSWLKPGSHLDLIGSFAPHMHEAKSNCFAGDVRLFVDTDEALMKSGDLLTPMKEEVFSREDVAGTLADLVAQKGDIDRPPEQRTVFKAVGTALEDLAAATLVLGNS